MAEATAAPAAPSNAPATKPATPAAAKPGAAPPAGEPAAPAVDPFAELLKKSPLRIKADGKEHVIDSVDALIRRAQMGFGVEKVRTETSERLSKAEKVEQTLERLKGKDPRLMKAALTDLIGDPATVRQLMEQAVYEDLMAEEQAAKLSPEQRAQQEEVKRLKAEREELLAEKTKREQAEEAAREQQTVAALRDSIATSTMEALKTANIDPELAPLAMPAVVRVIQAAMGDNLPMEAVQAQAVEAAMDYTKKARATVLQTEPAYIERLMGTPEGQAFANALRKYDLKVHRERGLGTPPKPPTPAPKQEGPVDRWAIINAIERGEG